MKLLLSLAVAAAPGLVLAQTPRNFGEFVSLLLRIIDVLVVLVFALTFIVFVWGLAKAWILNVGDTDEVEKGKKIALWGIIVMVIMFGIWGILTVLRRSIFGV